MPYFPGSVFIPPRGYAPPSGWFVSTEGNGNPSSSMDLVAGRLYASPVDVLAFTTDAFRVGVGTAQSGGDTSTAVVALYYDDGSGSRPDFARGVISQAVVSLAAVANVTTVVTPVPLSAGRYWTVFLWNSSAPTTVPRVYGLGTPTVNLPSTSSVWYTPIAGYYVDGQAALPTVNGQSWSLAGSAGQIPVVGLRGA